MLIINPTGIRCRSDRTQYFATPHIIPDNISSGVERIITEAPTHSPFLCPMMDYNLDDAMTAGAMDLNFFTLVIRPFENHMQIPVELQGVRLEIEGVRILYEAGDDEYERDAGIIFQHLSINDLDVSGWMVMVKGYQYDPIYKKHIPTCYLSRRTHFTIEKILGAGMELDAPENVVKNFLWYSINLPIGRRWNPPQMRWLNNPLG